MRDLELIQSNLPKFEKGKKELYASRVDMKEGKELVNLKDGIDN